MKIDDDVLYNGKRATIVNGSYTRHRYPRCVILQDGKRFVVQVRRLTRAEPDAAETVESETPDAETAARVSSDC
jgi:hypothetical protein